MMIEDIEDIELELSTYCNAHCNLCYRNYKSFDEHYPDNFHRPLIDLKKQISEYKNLKWVRLVGSISEPTLYNHFLELVQFIKDKNIKIEICTNGSTNDETFWKELRNILTIDDKVYFTICGSTQELHSIYRTGTNLRKILNNAKHFRSLNKNDYAQCIKFDYNDKNFETNEFKNMVNEFSHIYWTETFLLKDESNYVNRNNLIKLKPYQKKIKSYETIEKIAVLKFKKGLSKIANCKAYNEKRHQIDINGNVYPCYLFLEASKGKKWNGSWDDILNMKHEVCKFCEKSIVQLCADKDLDFII